MISILPKFLKCKSTLDLIRVGRDCDGGYLVSKLDIEASEVIIGIGINDDWSFEKSFSKHKNIPTFAFDGSISRMFFLKEIIKAALRIDKPYVFLNCIKTYLSYINFFKGKMYT